MARALSTGGRFALAYLVLGLLVGAGLGTFIVLVKRPGPKPPPAWSSWRPAATGRDRLLEIARHVGSGYVLPGGNPLTGIRVGGVPGSSTVKGIAVPTKAKPKTLGDFKLYEPASKNAIYILCGLGKNCALNKGAQEQTPVTLLRREALELALYTMEYNRPIDNVLVFFPPAAGAAISATLFFHRSALESSLHNPLRKTLPQGQALLPGEVTSGERRTVDKLTKSSLYKYVSIANAPGFGRLVVVAPTS